MIDTNIKGLLYLTRFVVREWSRSGSLNLGSTAGQTYPAAMSTVQPKLLELFEGLKQDLWEHLRVSSRPWFGGNRI